MPDDQPIASPDAPPGSGAAPVAVAEPAVVEPAGGTMGAGAVGAGAVDVPATDAVGPTDRSDADELAALRTQLAALQEEREAVDAIAAELEQAEARAEQLAVQLTETRTAQLAAHRRAVLAEHHGQLVEELVMGDSPEAIDASVELARAAYERVAGQLRQSAAATVPAGASPRGEPGVEHLSPFEKIAGALRR